MSQHPVSRIEPSRPWTCGRRGCPNPRSWHARRAQYLEQTIGPRAGLEFEAEHPDPQSDGWSFDAGDDDTDPVQEMLDAYRRAIAVVTRVFDAWSATRPGSQEAATLERDLRQAWNTADDASDQLLAAFAAADGDRRPDQTTANAAAEYRADEDFFHRDAKRRELMADLYGGEIDR